MAHLQRTACVLFLTAWMGIYLIMERDKKNTFNNVREPAVKTSRFGEAVSGHDIKGSATDSSEQKMPAEINGPRGPEPTRYGDWEQKGRCTDF